MNGANAGVQRGPRQFAGLDAQVVGISVDSVFSHIAWQKKDIGLLDFPLCSDFYPHGGVASKFGVFRDTNPLAGINERAIFVVDKQGKIVMSRRYELGEQPDNEDVFEVLRGLSGK